MAKRFFTSKKWILFFVVALVPLYVGYNFLSVWSATKSSYEETAEAAIVLGAAQYNGEPSPVLRSRLEAAGDLYLANRVDLVVVTGGSQAGDVTTEAKTGYDFLSAGRFTIPESDLRLEVQGHSTYESIAASARFLKSEGITNVILVTDPYHAKRSELIAEEVGLEADTVITDRQVSLSRLARETLNVSAGRIVSFRRLDRFS